eukprot:6210400-Pleurochrysis_carterae.AAC.6
MGSMRHRPLDDAVHSPGFDCANGVAKEQEGASQLRRGALLSNTRVFMSSSASTFTWALKCSKLMDDPECMKKKMYVAMCGLERCASCVACEYIVDPTLKQKKLTTLRQISPKRNLRCISENFSAEILCLFG